MTKFMTTGAAYVHNIVSKTGDMLPMVWPTNYTKLASATMFTLFWAGNVFAPNAKFEGVSVQDFLQERYIACYQHLARYCGLVTLFQDNNSQTNSKHTQENSAPGSCYWF
jgi:hypothetical protein